MLTAEAYNAADALLLPNLDDRRWADLVVVWGATELDHRVSQLYHGPNVITAAKRGVAEVAVVARVWLDRPGRARRRAPSP